MAAGRLEREGFAKLVRTYRGYSSLPPPTLPTSPFSSIRDRRKQWRVNLGSGNTGSTSSVSDAHFRKTTMMASVHTMEGIGRCIGDCPKHQSSPFPTSVPHVVARTTPAATPDHGRRVRRLPGSPGPVGSSPGFLHTKWSGEETSHCHRARRVSGASHARAREAASFMQFPVALMWERRWTRMLAVCCAVSFAASLVEPARNTTWCRTDGERPLLADVFDCDPRWVLHSASASH